MTLPPDFQFSQNNLKDYLDCPRRFQLRHLQRLQWPAPQSEPIIEYERRTELGSHFHRLVQQHLLGAPVDTLTPLITDPDLRNWWDCYLNEAPLAELPAQRRPEYLLGMPFASYRLQAKYDLLAFEPGKRFVIIDWKTTAYRPRRASLLERIQTRLYLFVLVEAGQLLNGGKSLLPDQVEMIYWFPEAPQNPEHITYSAQQHASNRAFLSGLIHEIDQNKTDLFIMTLNEKMCQFCNYRSLCNRGQQAGDWQTSDDQDDDTLTGGRLDFDLDQIEEIAF